MNHSLPEPSVPAAPEASPATRRGRSRVTLGLAAGMLAGGAIGLVATTPAWTSAATDDSSVVALQEDTSTDGSAAADERHVPGERLRETLQPLVEEGVIDAAQADAVTDHLVENRPERRGRHERRAHRADVVAELIGIDRETLRAELESGRSIADVAEANGVDVQVVIDGLIAEAEERLDAAVERGLDEERAAERLEQITERISEGVDRTRDATG